MLLAGGAAARALLLGAVAVPGAYGRCAARADLAGELVVPGPAAAAGHDGADDADRAATFAATFEVGGFTLYEEGRDKVWRRQREFAFG